MTSQVPNRSTLRAFGAADLPFLDRLGADPDALGLFAWTGFIDVRCHRRRWEFDGYVGEDSAAVAVVSPDGTVAGIARWQAVRRGGPGPASYELGLGLVPEYRKRGLGTSALRLLVDHVFGCTTAHRLEALTEVGNAGGRAISERTGFRREGLLQGVVFRDGAWRDMVMYGLVRDAWPGRGAASGESTRTA